MTLLSHALAARESGLCVVPPRQDGTKAPSANWRKYQNERPTESQIRRWYADPERTGIGYVCGSASGGLELLEFEDLDTFEHFEQLAADHGLDGLWDRVADGYFECTPGGGVHVFWRTPAPGPNTKLASRPLGGGHTQVLIETWGEGGYAVAAPSNGVVHPSGGAYELLRGGVATIVEVDQDEREALVALARMLDEMPTKAAEPASLPGSRGDRPGDRFNALTSWDDLLPRYGWTFVGQQGEESYWRRPGKDRGVSATTNYRGSGVLKVFTTSTPLDADRTYTPFGFYATMEHGGDFSAAARALRGDPGPSGQISAATVSLASLPAPAFPLDVLPPAVRAYVSAAAGSLPVPPEMVAVPLLGFAGALVGNRLHVAVKPSWREYPALFLAEVAPPARAPDHQNRANPRRRPGHRADPRVQHADAGALPKRSPADTLAAIRPARPVPPRRFDARRSRPTGWQPGPPDHGGCRATGRPRRPPF